MKVARSPSDATFPRSAIRLLGALAILLAAPPAASARARPRPARSHASPRRPAVPVLPPPLPALPPESPDGTAAISREDALARALQFTVTIEGEGVYGAGVLVDPAAGLVLTALHVVESGRPLRISFVDGLSVPGRVSEIDRLLDLALVRIDPQPRRPAPPISDATRLRPGEELYAIGCPRRLGFTVTRGIVSFVGRPMDGQRYIQTDLPINEGNSGGPVLDTRGALVGTMSFILRRAQGLSFALPVNYAVERFPEIRPAHAENADYLARFRSWRGDVTPPPDRIGPL